MKQERIPHLTANLRHTPSGSSDEVINARSDAEMAEAELRLLETKIREKQRKERLLNEYRMRESIARQRIMDLQANQIHNH